MNPIYALAYSEYAVAERLSKLLPKKQGYSIAVPLSRKNKGYDLLVHRDGHAATFQVRSSRPDALALPKTDGAKTPRYLHYLRFNEFELQEGAADFYVLFGLYSHPDGQVLGKGKPARWWKHLFLLFTPAEMREFLGESSHFFDFGVNSDDTHIVRIRGAKWPHEECYEQYHLDKRVRDITGLFEEPSIRQPQRTPIRHEQSERAAA